MIKKVNSLEWDSESYEYDGLINDGYHFSQNEEELEPTVLSKKVKIKK